MKHSYSLKNFKCLIFLVFLLSVGINHAQNFNQSVLNFNGKGSVDRVTSLMYGPDDRLYVSEYAGLIKILTIERAGNNNYAVTEMETLTDVKTIQNHNDDGSLDTNQNRQVTGFTVVGTAENPIIYVTSSDFRIGGGGAGDIGVDTNSGVITRLTWDGTSWNVVDIVRGISRSEENHAISGIEFVTINGSDYLIVTSGGHTNGGAPSNNFGYLTEYALSSAILSVNLTMIESFPIQTDNNGRDYIYDMPTLDDPTRPNINEIEDPDALGYDGIDVNDPFGGNDGLNQGKIVIGGPVQIFSPGYRNSYDLVVTETGGVYATDNGANGGWGGFPVNEGLLGNENGSLATNDYDPLEPGSSSPSENEQINNKDHLQFITNDIQSYAFGSYYGGHPNPIRANPDNAGLYTAPNKFGYLGAVFRTQVYDPDGSTPNSTTDPNIALPADWPPVPPSMADPNEGDWRGPNEINPDGPNDSELVYWGTNTNGIDEYTASNFDGILKGDLLAGTNSGQLRRVKLKADGTLQTFTPVFVSGLGGNCLGVTCNSDSDIFPGSIWIGTFNNSITVLEPQDFINCIAPEDEDYDPIADYDYDGYSNQDEADNITDPCNGASQPDDFDKPAGGSLISNINDNDDDNDGILDANDPFQLGDYTNADSDAFILPVINELFSDNPLLGGYLGLGLTGLMNNGDPNGNWLNWIDRKDDPNDPNPNDVLGGAIGAMTMHMTSGTALGTSNNQEKAFQYGIQTDQNIGIFTVSGAIANFYQPLQLYGNTSAPNGELGFFIGDGTQSNYIKFVARPQGLRVQQEINDIPQTPIDLLIDASNRPSGTILFSFIINPATGEITLQYNFDNGIPQTFGTISAEGAILTAIQNASSDLAVGFIGTSNASDVELEGTWTFLNVEKEFISQITAESIPDQFNTKGDVLNGSLGVLASGGEGDLTFSATGLPLGITLDAVTGIFNGSISYSNIINNPYNVTITIDDNDGDSTDNLNLNFSWTITSNPGMYNSIPTVRVNAGGSGFTATDSSVNWAVNTASGATSGPGYTVNTGNIYSNGLSNMARHSSIPDYIDGTTFNNLFANERWDGSSAPEMQFSFPLPDAEYLVNIYLANSISGTSTPGKRVFDIAIEGAVVKVGVDIASEFGHQIGGMISLHVTSVTDGTLNIEFLHGLAENPLVNAIEIRTVIDENAILADDIADQTNNIGDLLDGSLIVLASGGNGNLNFSATGLPPGVNIDPTNGQIGGEIASGTETNTIYNVTVTVDDSDEDYEDIVVLDFIWTVYSGIPISSIPTVRVNAAGSGFTATDSGVDWAPNTASGATSGPGYTVNTGNRYATGLANVARHASIPDYIDQATLNALFANERWDGGSAPEMLFSFPLPNAEYLVNVYLANSTNGTSTPGKRVFDIAIESTLVRSGVDMASEFGHQVAGMLSFPITLSDGTLNIEFLHGLAENPLVNAIEIRTIIDENAILADDIADQTNNIGDLLDGSLIVLASGGNGNLNFSATGLPPGVTIEPTNGLIGGEIAPGAETNSPYNVTVTVDDSDADNEDIVTLNFFWTVYSGVTVNSIPTVRVNAAGSGFTATDSGVDWAPNTASGATSGPGYTVNTGNRYATGLANVARHASIPDYIDQATLNALFANERWDGGSAPEMLFSFPLPNAEYLVNVYLANSTNGTSTPGKRVFDIAIEGAVVRSAMDMSLEFGHQVAGMLSFPITLSDGTLNIEFLHGLAENPLVNAIEIRTVIDENAIIANDIADQTNDVGDILDGSLLVMASGGDGNLNFSATGLPPGVTIEPTNGLIGGEIASGAETNSPYNVTVTVDDSDADNEDIVTLNFFWTVYSGVTVNSIPTVRVNAAGSGFTATDSGVDWAANTASGATSGPGYTVNTGNRYATGLANIARHTSIPDYIDQATLDALFANERWDSGSAPEMQFSFPLPDAEYLVNIYLANSTNGTSTPGKRVFDIAIEGAVVRSAVDMSMEFGHQVAGMLSFPITLSDGTLNIEFLHGLAENPLVNAIEIRTVIDENAILADDIADQTNNVGDLLDGSLIVLASGGNGNLNFSATGLPPGVNIDPTNGQIGGEIASGAETNSPYNVTVTVDDSDADNEDIVTLNFFWTIFNINNPSWNDKNEDETYTARHENSLVQAGDKFYLMGGRENSKTIDVYDYTSDTWTSLVDSAPFEFNHFQATEYQGLIWVIGSFKSNGFPNEVPAEYVWSFNPASEEWVQGPEIPVSRRRGSAGLVIYNEKFYVVGGNNQGHNGGYVAWYDEFDPATGQWTILPDAPRPRDHFFATVIGDKLYAAGGRLSGGPGGTFAPTIAEVDVYNFITGTWSTLPSTQNIPTPRGGAAAALFDNKLFIIGGEVDNQVVYGVRTSDALAITEAYDPTTGTWSRLADLNHKRHGTQAIVSGNGIFILAGSVRQGGGNQKNMEFYGGNTPSGSPSMASIFSAPSDVMITGTTGNDILLEVTGGNVGILIKSIEIVGINASDFEISSGGLANALMKSNSSHNLGISYNGSTDNASADLIINYGASSTLMVHLTGMTSNTEKKQEDKITLNTDQFNDENYNVIFFPNPTSSETTIKLSNQNLELTQIDIYDVSGRLIKTFNAPKIKSDNGLYKLDVSRLEDGTYFINLKTNEASIHVGRLIIE